MMGDDLNAVTRGVNQMSIVFRIFIATILLLTISEDFAAQDAWAQTLQINPVLPPQGFGVQDTGQVISTTYPGGYYPFDIATSLQANWFVAAWSNAPGESYLSPFFSLQTLTMNNQTVSDELWISTSSQTASQSMAIMIDYNVASGLTSQTIFQVGIPDASYCATPDGDPLEHDFFVAANSKSVDPNYPSAYERDGQTPPPNPSLDQLTALTINGSVALLAALSAASPGQCPLNQSAMIYALVFSNTVNHQTLFYQLDFNWFCYAGTDPDVNTWCETAIPQMNYFMTGQGGIWGIDDPISNYVNRTTKQQYALLQGTSVMDVDIDFLPRIAQLIQTNQNGIDADLSHWQWGSFYFGQHTWGSAALVSSWTSANFSPSLSIRPSGSAAPR